MQVMATPAVVMDLSGLLKAKSIRRYIQHHMCTQNLGDHIDTINFTSGPKKCVSLIEVMEVVIGLVPQTEGILTINRINFPYISPSTTVDESESLIFSGRLAINTIQMKLKNPNLCFYLSRVLQSLVQHKWLAIEELQIVMDPIPSLSNLSLWNYFVLDEEPPNLSQTKVRILLTTDDEPLECCSDTLPDLGKGIEVESRKREKNVPDIYYHHKVFLLAEDMEQLSPDSDQPKEQAIPVSDQRTVNSSSTSSVTSGGGQSIPISVRHSDDLGSTTSSTNRNQPNHLTEQPKMQCDTQSNSTSSTSIPIQIKHNDDHVSTPCATRRQPIHVTEQPKMQCDTQSNSTSSTSIPIQIKHNDDHVSTPCATRRQPIHVTEQPKMQRDSHFSSGTPIPIQIQHSDDPVSSSTRRQPIHVTEQQLQSAVSNSGGASSIPIQVRHSDDLVSSSNSTEGQAIHVAEESKMHTKDTNSSLDKYTSSSSESIPVRIHDSGDDLDSKLTSTKGGSNSIKLQLDYNDSSTVDISTPMRKDQSDQRSTKRRGSCPDLRGNQSSPSKQKSNERRIIPIKHKPDPVNYRVMFTRLWLPEKNSLPVLDSLFDCGITGKGVAVAVLGIGCDVTDKAMFRGEVSSVDGGTCSKVFATRNFVSDNSPIFDASNKTTLLSYIAVGSGIVFPVSDGKLVYHGIAPGSALIVCKTAREDGTIVNGATSKAIDWLTDQWISAWNTKFAGLVALIPYGGQYMDDEMRAIHRASDNSIIIVCAAGEKGKNVAFPAALGNVIAVGSKSGPTGREVDFSTKEAVVSTVQLVKRTDLSEIMGLVSTGVEYSFHSKPIQISGTALAAAVATGIISLLVSYITQALKSRSEDDLIHKQIKSVLLKRLSRGYLHTCIIRELLMEVGSGHHDNKLGYGEVNTNIFELEEEQLLVKLANIISRDLPEIPGASYSTGDGKLNEITDKTRQAMYHGLTGKGITVAVIDDDFATEGPVVISSEKRNSHGDDCAQVLLHVAPRCTCIAINDVSDDFSEGFNTCLDKYNTNVISFSGAIDSFSPELSKAISRAIMAGVIVVCAAGNEGQVVRNTLSYPGRLGNVLCIGGRDRYHRQLPFSSSGKELDFLAPAIFCEGPGTSLAAPTVAGFIALLLQFVMEEMSAEEVEAWAKNSENCWEWCKIPVFQACCNVYALRTLLKTLVSKPQEYSEAIGFGCVDISVIFQAFDPLIKPLVTSAAKKHILSTIQKFYNGEY